MERRQAVNVLKMCYPILLWSDDGHSMALPRHMLEFATVGTLEMSKMLFAHPREQTGLCGR